MVDGTQHSAHSTQHWRREAVGAFVVLVSRILTTPRTPWENDEFLFAEAVRKFDPSRYHPHPPGYPLYVLLGKIVNAIIGDPWLALVIVSIIAAPIGFVALARAFRRWIDDPDLALIAALLYYFSAGMLVQGTLALSDDAAIMFLGLALLAISRIGDAEDDRNALAVGIWTSAAIGCRPQLVIPILPMLLVALLQMRTMRQRIACVAAFVFISVIWLLPLMEAAGGWDGLLAYEQKQAAYFASHDAGLSRGAKTTGEIVARFVFHPWGSKYISFPLILCSAIGAISLLTVWRRASSPAGGARDVRPYTSLLPLIVFTIVQLGFELGWMDPADAARYSLPSMILFALFAACGFDVVGRSVRIRAIPWIAALFFAAISFWYSFPILAARTRGPSPVVAAAAYANQHFAPNTVILYDLSLRPHAEYLMPRFRSVAIEPGLAELYDRPDVPLVLFVDGGSHWPEAKVFGWPSSDAYGKLTRNHYREVTLDPIRPEERYLPLAGVYPLERTIAGDEWRWLASDAAIRLPHAHRATIALAFRLSPDTPYAADVVRVGVNGRAAGEVVARKTPAAISVVLPAGPVEIEMHSQQAFAPARVLHNQDPRILAVQLVGVDKH
jgi:hypothetical protein